jgi:hypothetical protein
MKKLMTAMLGLSLLTGLASVTFARPDDTTTTTTKKKKSKAKKPKASTTDTTKTTETK